MNNNKDTDAIYGVDSEVNITFPKTKSFVNHQVNGLSGRKRTLFQNECPRRRKKREKKIEKLKKKKDKDKMLTPENSEIKRKPYL